jgi:hypothetical protein
MPDPRWMTRPRKSPGPAADGLSLPVFADRERAAAAGPGMLN